MVPRFFLCLPSKLSTKTHSDCEDNSSGRAG